MINSAHMASHTRASVRPQFNHSSAVSGRFYLPGIADRLTGEKARRLNWESEPTFCVPFPKLDIENIFLPRSFCGFPVLSKIFGVRGKFQ